MEELKTLVKNGDYAAAWPLLLKRAAATDDIVEMGALCRQRRRLLKNGAQPEGLKKVRIALLSGATTESLEEPLLLALEATGIQPELYRGDFNSYARDILDADSALHQFRPEVAIIVNTAHNNPLWPAFGDDLSSVEEKVDAVCDHWLDLCARLRERAGCEILLHNFHPMPTRPQGNLSARLPWDENNFLMRVNLRLGDRAPAYVHIVDIAALAADYGVQHWFDPRYWYHAKQPVAFECLVPYVRNVARITGALFGFTAKCLVLDLDNTLWGGVIGDDGLDGIALGEGDARGEAFKAFQTYVMKLKERGVLLAVCSKNEMENALLPFEQHPEMVIKRDDIVAFMANWDPKPDNILAIARTLNIGINSLVFVDDNPAEREHVRQRLPEVTVIELTDDPAMYPMLVDRSGAFEITSLSEEDRQRTAQYQENAQRSSLMESVVDYRDYLMSLTQEAVINPFESMHLDRITQLINKSNQFNLTTLRQTRSQVEALMNDAAVLTATVRVRDRFGDNGLIAVFFARMNGSEMWIDEWLMSCRVLKRQVEHLLCNYVVEKAVDAGIETIYGTYIPTKKNPLVRDHYSSLGFEFVKDGENDSTIWALKTAAYKPFDVPIKRVESY